MRFLKIVHALVFTLTIFAQFLCAASFTEASVAYIANENFTGILDIEMWLKIGGILLVVTISLALLASRISEIIIIKRVHQNNHA